MLKNLFDLSYERNEYEAIVFYFIYVVFAWYVAGIFNFIVDNFNFSFLTVATLLGLFFLIPFVFYTFLSIAIIFKKNLKDSKSIYLVFYTIVLTLVMPILLGFLFVWINNHLGYEERFMDGLKGGLLAWFFPGLILGCIPAAILTTKEDCSLKKEIQKMEQGKLEHEIKIEKQLLLERTMRIKQEEVKNLQDNEDGEK